MHDKVFRSEYSGIWHVLWPGFEITMNNTKKHNQVMKENTKMDRKQCTFLLVHVCVNNLSFHCAFWCNKQYFFQLSKQCAWLRAVTPQNVIIAAKCNNTDAKCNKIFNTKCNNLSTQIVITFLTQNVIISE